MLIKKPILGKILGGIILLVLFWFVALFFSSGRFSLFMLVLAIISTFLFPFCLKKREENAFTKNLVVSIIFISILFFIVGLLFVQIFQDWQQLKDAFSVQISFSAVFIFLMQAYLRSIREFSIKKEEKLLKNQAFENLIKSGILFLIGAAFLVIMLKGIKDSPSLSKNVCDQKTYSNFILLENNCNFIQENDYYKKNTSNVNIRVSN